MVANYYKVDKTGSFRITTDSQGELVIHAAAARHASAERVLPSGTSGTISINFALPLAQDIQVVWSIHWAMGCRMLPFRSATTNRTNLYRRLLFGPDERTDGDGRFLIRDVGIQVPFGVTCSHPTTLPHPRSR